MWDESVMRRMDMVMLTLLNAQERTEAEFRELFRAADEGFVFKVSLCNNELMRCGLMKHRASRDLRVAG